MALTLPRLMMETTFLATSEKLWPPPERSFGGPLSSPAKFAAKNASMAARPAAVSRSPSRDHVAVPANGQDVAFVLVMRPQSRQPLIAHQHQVKGLVQPGGLGRIEAAGAVFDGVAAVGRKRLAGLQHDGGQRFRGKAFDGIAIKALRSVRAGWRASHFLRDSRPRATAHEFVNSPLPFRQTPSHICPKPARASATTAAG